MKSTFLHAGFIALLALTLGTLSSCEDDPIVIDPTVAALNIQVRFAPGGQTFQPGDTYTINGTAVKFNALRFYMTGIGLEDVAGNLISSDVVILAEPGQASYPAGEVIPQAYTRLKGNIGIDPVTNHEDPTQYTSDNPLALQSPNMHWSWTSGYIFLRIDGIYDGDGDNIPDEGNGFEVHLGSDNFLTGLDMPISIGSDQSESITVKMVYDPLALFTGVDFPTVNTTHTMDNMPMAMTVKANIPSAFTIEN